MVIDLVRVVIAAPAIDSPKLLRAPFSIVKRVLTARKDTRIDFGLCTYLGKDDTADYHKLCHLELDSREMAQKSAVKWPTFPSFIALTTTSRRVECLICYYNLEGMSLRIAIDPR